jgi:chromosome segregation ATPase
MNEQLLIQILEEIKEIKMEQKEMKAEQKQTNERLNSIEAFVSDIPLIRQAVLETRDDVKQLEAVQSNLISEHHTFAHHFNVIDKQLVDHAIEIDKLKADNSNSAAPMGFLFPHKKNICSIPANEYL